MFSHERAHNSQRGVPFIEYLNAVDDVLKLLRGHASEQSELGLIAAAQENGYQPVETAEGLTRQRRRCDVPPKPGGRA